MPSGQFLNVIMGCNQKPFDDPRVRKALSLSVDRPALLDLVAEGYGTVGADVAANAAYRFYDKLPPKKDDVAQAKSLLAAAGYPNGLSVTLVASDQPGTRTQLGDGQARRVQHHRADHGARHLPGPGVAEGTVLRRAL